MNYEQTDLQEQLAGAYVVGTLRGPARARFERVCAGSQNLRAAVCRWEARLMPLLRGLAPITPGRHVWKRISRRISRRVVRPTLGAAAWRWAVVGALALSLIVTVSIRILNPPLQQVAMVGRDRAHLVWNIARSANSTTLTIRALEKVQSDPQMAYELWALPENGKPPVSLGLLPRSGMLNRTLSPAQRVALQNSGHVAVSLEPAGGSPTGSPTGPVLYVAAVPVTG